MVRGAEQLIARSVFISLKYKRLHHMLQFLDKEMHQGFSNDHIVLYETSAKCTIRSGNVCRDKAARCRSAMNAYR